MNGSKLSLDESIKSGSNFVAPEDDEIQQFINDASASDLLKFIRKRAPNERFAYHNEAKFALSGRIAVDAAISADKMIQQTKLLTEHTEKLTTQTEIHIQHSEKLTKQTAELLKESVTLRKLTNKLVFLTVVLGAFTFIQISLMVADIFKHK